MQSGRSLLNDDVQEKILSFLIGDPKLRLVSRQFNIFFKNNYINLLDYMKNVIEDISIADQEQNYKITVVCDELKVDGKKINEINKIINASFDQNFKLPLGYVPPETEQIIYLFYYKLLHVFKVRDFISPIHFANASDPNNEFFVTNRYCFGSGKFRDARYKQATFAIKHEHIVDVLKYMLNLNITSFLIDVNLQTNIAIESMKSNIPEVFLSKKKFI